jgi:uroporphyrin-III C-methyltransferase
MTARQSSDMNAKQPGVVGRKGKVYLVGAGPGDPELLTRKALRVLQAASVVLHDDLVAPEILALAPRSATIHNVGKRCGRKTMTQEEIHDRMIDAARDGHTVVRLKGGDPMVYGRAGEELQALHTAGIEFEVIPGVTSAFAAAAAAHVALTDRRFASRIVFLTGHRCGAGRGADGLEGVTPNSTIVIYMPGERIAQIAEQLEAAGMAATTPCLVVSAASTPRQHIYRLTLHELLDSSRWPAPAVLIVGEVVAQSPIASAERSMQRNKLPGFAPVQKEMPMQNELPMFAATQNERPPQNELPAQAERPEFAHTPNSAEEPVPVWRRLILNVAEAWY